MCNTVPYEHLPGDVTQPAARGVNVSNADHSAHVNYPHQHQIPASYSWQRNTDTHNSTSPPANNNRALPPPFREDTPPPIQDIVGSASTTMAAPAAEVASTNEVHLPPPPRYSSERNFPRAMAMQPQVDNNSNNGEKVPRHSQIVSSLEVGVVLVSDTLNQVLVCHGIWF